MNEIKAWFGRLDEIDGQRAQVGKLYREFLRVPSMSAGLYVLPASSADSQRPHQQDEMYYVTRGRARFRAGDQDVEVSAGSVLFVAAEVEHGSYDITEELAALVFFAPAETEPSAAVSSLQSPVTSAVRMVPICAVGSSKPLP